MPSFLNHLPPFVANAIPGGQFEVLSGYDVADVGQSLSVLAVGLLLEQLFGFGVAVAHHKIIYLGVNNFDSNSDVNQVP